MWAGRCCPSWQGRCGAVQLARILACMPLVQVDTVLRPGELGATLVHPITGWVRPAPPRPAPPRPALCLAQPSSLLCGTFALTWYYFLADPAARGKHAWERPKTST